PGGQVLERRRWPITTRRRSIAMLASGEHGPTWCRRLPSSGMRARTHWHECLPDTITSLKAPAALHLRRPDEPGSSCGRARGVGWCVLLCVVVKGEERGLERGVAERGGHVLRGAQANQHGGVAREA